MSTFESKFIAMKTVVEHVEALNYKLQMFVLPIEGPKCVLQQRGSFQEHLDSRLNIEKEAYKYMLSSGQGSSCCTYDVSGQGRYRNQLG